MIAGETFFKLFVLRRIERIAGNIDLGFALVSLDIEAVGPAYDHCHDTQYLKIKEEGGRVYPAVGDVFEFGVFQFYGLIQLLIHNEFN
jgi:hypothetical protein